MTDINPDGTPVQPNDGTKVTPPATEGKIFSQDQVNDIVAGRLAKEKDKYKDYDALKTKAGEYDSLKPKYDSLESANQTSQTVLKEAYEGLLKSVAEDKKSLIPDQLNEAEKIKYITRNQALLFNVKAIEKPVTPTAPEQNKGQAGLFGGKYNSLGEWAAKDPKGYLEYRKANP